MVNVSWHSAGDSKFSHTEDDEMKEWVLVPTLLSPPLTHESKEEALKEPTHIDLEENTTRDQDEGLYHAILCEDSDGCYDTFNDNDQETEI